MAIVFCTHRHAPLTAERRAWSGVISAAIGLFDGGPNVSTGIKGEFLCASLHAWGGNARGATGIGLSSPGDDGSAAPILSARDMVLGTVRGGGLDPGRHESQRAWGLIL